MSRLLKNLEHLDELKAKVVTADEAVSDHKAQIVMAWCPFKKGDEIVSVEKPWDAPPVPSVPWSWTHKGRTLRVSSAYISNIRIGHEDPTMDHIEFTMRGCMLKKDGSIGQQDGEAHVRILINETNL